MSGAAPVVIGGGIAGLVTALGLAPEPVLLLSRGPLGAQSSSALAQGGLAAAVGADDTVALHMQDTLAAGDGLCATETARRIIKAAPDAVAALQRFGVRFDRTADGTLSLGLEAAHGRRRILHAAGDGTGREIVRALVAAVLSTPSVTVVEHGEACRLTLRDGAVAGVLVRSRDGVRLLSADRVVIATGGLGDLFHETTNPAGNWGQGLMLAAHAGAVLADLEFIQFHPTALDVPARPMRLISEAVRGEGAVLIDETGARFLEDVPGAELAPRDVVGRAVAAHIGKGHRVFLDARNSPGSAFPARFPAIHAACRAAGIDPATMPIPVRPAAHYHMGGIAVDAEGRSSVPGLWACGEAASTGLHGANRLASNSLVEAAVCAMAVARSVSGAPATGVRTAPAAPPCPPLGGDPSAVRSIVSCALGPVRDGAGLDRAVAALSPMAAGNDAAALALTIALAARRRRESRGAHFRADFPGRLAAAGHSRSTLAAALAVAGQAGIDTETLAMSA